MKNSGTIRGFISLILFLLIACSSNNDADVRFAPKEVIDLGAIITEDLLSQIGFDESDTFDVWNWELTTDNGGRVHGTSARYTLYNHGGPHVDAPIHIGVGKGLDTYPIDAFIGPLKVFDVSEYQKGHSIGKEVFQDKVSPGDIVLIYTNFKPTGSLDGLFLTTTLTYETSEYLATLPVRAFGTDAPSVYSSVDTTSVNSDSEVARGAPIHHSFLSRSIPVYELLFNLEKLLDKRDMVFIGVPVNIKDGDAMLVRPIVIIQ